jgi:PKD repeat protein
MKRTWPFLLALLVLAAPATQGQYQWTTNNGTFTYTPAATNVTITGYSGDDDAAIPSEITNLPVTAIGINAFGYNTALASVTMPNTVTSIGDEAFAGCSSLTSVSIPGSVTSIGVFAFLDTGLTNVTIPNSVTTIGGAAFGGCASLLAISVDSGNSFFSSSNGILFDASQTTLIEFPGGIGGNCMIPAGVTGIADAAFDGCSRLTSVTIPNSVTSIGYGAFTLCTSVTNVTIPDSVTTIGDQAFLECVQLTSANIPSSVTGMGAVPFLDCASLTAIVVDTNNPAYISLAGVLFDKSQTTLLEFPGGLGGNYAIPMGVTNIADAAFDDCYNLFSISIPQSVTSIVGDAFNECTGLNSVYFTGNAPNVDSTAFLENFGYDPATAYYEPGSSGWGNFSAITGIPAVELPAIAVTANPTNGAVPLRVSFTSSGIDSAGHTISNWNWTFGDGAASAAQNPSHTYTTAGVFSVALIETNRNGGLSAGSSASITASPPPGLASLALAGANLVFNGTNGQSGGTYYMLTSTNLALPLSQRTPVATNILSASGNFSITATNTVTPAVRQRFYILETP